MKISDIDYKGQNKLVMTYIKMPSATKEAGDGIGRN